MAVAEERESRSVALETAYVHDVYDQISAHCSCCPATSCSSLQAEANGTSARVWPRVRQFLQDLEPGSLVCDVGCGSGKYLHVNPDVFKVGGDRCSRLTELAREKEHEVMVCDNLALPFRDDSFDAVLSVAVVHHFATTERRVNALRELARVLRIGGRLLISVWAMEQRHRKFESQDVLVPWHRPQPQHVSTPSLELASTCTTCTTTTSEEADAAGPPPYHAYTQTSDSDSARSVRAAGQQPRKRGRSRHKGRSIDPARPSSSQSSSDLSSPNETCYSFVRRALQKLAGGRRGGRRHRAWFLDSWNACTKEPSCTAATDVTPDALLAEAGRRAAGRDDSQDDVADALDLPIELRRLEDVEPSPTSKNVASPPRRRRTLACSVPTPPRLDPTPLKSQSLGDILDTARPESLVRSRSSVARLPVIPPVEVSQSPTPAVPIVTTTTSSHPQLVRQKRSLCEDDEEGEEAAREAEDRPGPAPTRRADLRDLVRALPEVGAPRRGVPKQRSLNDELMATQRQREKARVRQNITKQASLNEQLLSRGPLGSLKDSLLASPRFQQLRSGLTKLTSISASPADATKVAGQSFKNGFVRMLQNWKGEPPPDVPHLIPPTSPLYPPQSSSTPPVSPLRRCAEEEAVLGLAPVPSRCERRLSREEGSDSSKDSSLQSDTSVDSEDSFASVIFVPKPETKSTSSPPEKSPPPNSNPQPTPPAVEPEMVVEPVAPVTAPPQPKQGTIRAETLKRIQLLLQERAPRTPVFPLVRRSSAHPVGRTDQSLARPIPRLLSLELFNPETDDLDSDSSGVSSPDSVISVMEPGRAVSEKTVVCTAPAELVINDEVPETQRPASSLLEAAASVASSLEGAVDAVIQSSPRARRKLAAMGLRGSPSPPPVPPRPPVWDEECRQHLTEFADRLSEKLLQEIDRYSETLQSSSSRNSQFRAMARFPREHERFSPEPSKLAGEEDVVRLDPERYLQDLQEINSDIGSQLAKLNEELESLPLHINVNNNNSPRMQSPNNNTNHTKKNKTVANLVSPAKELPDCNENSAGKIELKRSIESLTSCSQSAGQNQSNEQEPECNTSSASRIGSERERSHSIMSGHESEHSQNSLNRSRPDLERSLSTSGRSPSSLSGPESERSHGRSPSGSEQERSHSAAGRNRPDLERSLSNSGRSPSSLSGPESERSHGRSPSGSEQERSHSAAGRSRPDLERSLSTSGRSPSSLSGPESERSHGRSPSGSEQERSHSGRSPSSLSGPEVSQSVSGRSPSSLSGPEPPTRQVSWEESSPELRRDTSRDSGEDVMCKNKRKSLTRQLASVTGWPELETVPPKVTKTESYETSLSGSTSQDSLQSSSAGSGGPIGAGGALTFHRYYHVFREGELDTLIERYVENLHIISSYYDHANWCVIAEKVQVWTI